MGSRFWPTEDEEKLAKLVAEGFSGGQIAFRMFRYSRSAVMGKVWRLKLKMARSPSSTVGISRATGSRMPRARKSRGMVTDAPVQDTLPDAVEQSEPVARAATPPDGGSRHYSPGEALMALEPGDCRWPIGTVGERTFHFCRAPQQGHGPYCQAHRAKAKSKGPEYGWFR